MTYLLPIEEADTITLWAPNAIVTGRIVHISPATEYDDDPDSGPPVEPTVTYSVTLLLQAPAPTAAAALEAAGPASRAPD